MFNHRDENLYHKLQVLWSKNQFCRSIALFISHRLQLLSCGISNSPLFQHCPPPASIAAANAAEWEAKPRSTVIVLNDWGQSFTANAAVPAATALYL